MTSPLTSSRLRNITAACGFLAVALTYTATAQTPEPSPAPKVGGCLALPNTCQTEVFHIGNATQQNDANEILVMLRNILPPHIKVFLASTQNIIVLQASPEDIKLARKLTAELDQPRKRYRVTYTIAESDGGKRIGNQHFSMIMFAGQRTTLKQGSKVPVLTGSYNATPANGSPGVQTQYTYLDVGMSFDATLTPVESGAVIRAKVEQSSIADQKSALVETDPVVRQTVVEGTAFLAPGKPVVLGSIDIIGSTRHVDIDVMMEPLL